MNRKNESVRDRNGVVQRKSSPFGHTDIKAESKWMTLTKRLNIKKMGRQAAQVNIAILIE